MILPEEGHLLRIFIGESDRHDGVPLHEWLVRRARERGLAGATVLRGMEGFGARSRLHTAKFLRLSSDLPVVIEIVDTIDKIESFLPEVDMAVREGLATIERVQVRLYRADQPAHEPDDGDGEEDGGDATGPDAAERGRAAVPEPDDDGSGGG